MAVGENLIGQQYNSCFRWLFRGFLNPYNSPMKYQIDYSNITTNPQNNNAKHTHSIEQLYYLGCVFYLNIDAEPITNRIEVEIPLTIAEKDCGMKIGNHRLHTARRTAQNCSHALTKEVDL
jgi:hypothetical protein